MCVLVGMNEVTHVAITIAIIASNTHPAPLIMRIIYDIRMQEELEKWTNSRKVKYEHTNTLSPSLLITQSVIPTVISCVNLS